MRNEEVEDAATRLFEAEQERRQIRLLSLEFPNASMEDAYRVQAALVRRKVNSGLKPKGWKIGLTSKAMQSALNIDIPDSGVLFDNMFFDTGSHIPSGRFIKPRVEAEIAFVMKAPLSGERVTVEDVIAATDYVTPSLEILDTRIERFNAETKKARTIFDTISDNAANAGVVLSSLRLAPREVDMRWMGAIVTRNGEVEETGLGAGVLNHPAAGIVWLTERLRQFGMQIMPGEVVLSGSFVRPVEANSGDTIIADFGAFGTVDVTF